MMKWTAEEFQSLPWIEHVRQRPAMYIMDTKKQGLRNLLSTTFLQLVKDLDVEEVSAEIEGNGSYTFSGTGKNISEERCLALLNDLNNPLVQLGHYMNWPAALRALSSSLQAVITLSKETVVINYECGKEKDFARLSGSGDKSALRLSFVLDKSIMSETEMSLIELQTELHEVCCLCGNKRYKISDGVSLADISVNGLADLALQRIPASYVKEKPIVFSFEKDNCKADILIADDYSPKTLSYVNGWSTPEHGSHVEGVKGGIIEYGRLFGKEYERESVLPKSIIISIWLNEPRYFGASRSRLHMDEIKELIVGQAKSKLITLAYHKPN